MAKISIYPLDSNPKLSDKLIGTSVGFNEIGNLENPTYNFSLQQLLDLFSPLLPGNTLQGVLDNNNTATEDINLFGTIYTTDLEVSNISNLFSVYISDSLYVEGSLFDRNNSQGSSGQILRSTGSGIEWFTPSNTIPTLQQVLTSGNEADVEIILTANITAEGINADTVLVQDSFELNGSFIDLDGLTGTSGQMLTSLGSAGVSWKNVPVYTASTPLSINPATKNITIQQANSTQNGYLSYADWISFDGKQNALSGTGIVVSSGGTISYITNNSTNWNLAYNDTIVSVAVTGTSTKLLTLTQRDGGTLTTNWSDSGAGTLGSVGLSMPVAFNVLNSPLTSDGTIQVQAAGTSSQYIKGDGTLATFPTLTGYVPYTGATSDVDLGTHKLTASDLVINHASGSGVAASITKGGNGEALTVVKSSGSGNAASITGGVTLLSELHLTTSLADAYIASAATWNAKQNAITLTTTGSSGAATLIGATLNIPQYTDQFTGTVTSVAALTLGTIGTDLSSTVANATTTPVITLNVPTASAANRGALSAADWSTFNTKVGGVTASSPLASSGGSTPNITIQQASGSQDGYLSSTDWTTFNSKQASGNYITSLTGEATAAGPGAASVTLNNASVTAKVLTGINITGGTVQSTDTMLTAFGKLQNQINGLIGSTIYQGTWNASTNTPSLSSGVGVRGYYYIVSVAGSTNLDGITDWSIGDWAIFDGTAWQQVDNTDAVVSVNGQTGAVSLTTDNISEGTTNLYYLDSRSRAALSFTAGSGAYNSTTGVITIPTNTSQLTNGSNFITLASLSGSAPIGYNNTTGEISITQSGTASNGYLSSTDWNTFNNKQNGLSGTGFVKISGTTISYDNSTYINNTTAQTIGGVKTFSNMPILSPASGVNGQIIYADASNQLKTITNFRYNDSTGVLTTLLGNLGSNAYTSTAFVPEARTITINGVTQDLSANQTWTVSGGISGSGTTNYLPKFTGSSAIGNSQITDNGTNVIVGGSGTSTFKFLVAVPGTSLIGSSVSMTSVSSSQNAFQINHYGTGNLIEAAGSTAVTSFSVSNSGGGYFAGNVGIGTTSPTTKLTVYGGYANFTDGTINVYAGSDGNGGLFGTITNHYQRFITNDTERMRITSGGNVGIGTQSPSSALDVRGVVTITDTNPYIRWNNTSGTRLAYIQHATDLVLNTDTGAMAFATNNNERMRIAFGGNVGIGTPSPAEKLDVSGSVRITGQATNFSVGSAGLNIDRISASGLIRIYGVTGTGSAGDLALGTDNSERMRITSGGNVGIGNASPTSAGGYATLSMGGSGSTKGQITWNSGATNIGYSYNDSTNMTFGANNDLIFATTSSGNERMRITSGGNVGIGTTSPTQGKLVVVGGVTNSIATISASFGTNNALNIGDDGTNAVLGVGNSGTDIVFLKRASGVYSEAMRIASDGALLLGTYSQTNDKVLDLRSNAGILSIVTSATNSQGSTISYSYANGSQGPLKFANAGGVIMTLQAGGTINMLSLGTGIVYSNGGTLTSTNPSDSRLKEDIADLQYGLNEILQLRPVSYNWKNDNINQGKQFGFIAQEVQEVMPELVKEFETEDGERLGLDKEGIYAALVNAIKELKQEIEILKNK